ncbi:MAG: cation diffusion facilitator family transporter, partial [Elusimicrobia bacterium]|nr:cation diffusion facilitator family transporter [Elusimicrobiota bacterium]MBD3412532.1 cation diffusion facilitator family transporter [Elusimicrobiota bacterium]
GILHGEHHHDRNIKGIVMHMLADTGSSVAIVISAFIIAATGWYVIDPVVSIGISLIIASWAWGLLKDSINVLLETAPRGIMTDEVARRIEQEIPEVKRVDDIHIWEITSNMYSMTAHITVADMSVNHAGTVKERISQFVYDTYGIGHTTIQFRA